MKVLVNIGALCFVVGIWTGATAVGGAGMWMLAGAGVWKLMAGRNGSNR